jgi:hypothetical protein
MEHENIDARISELSKEFTHAQYIKKKDLKDFYQHDDPNLSDQDFRRILYRLENKAIISSAGSGIYYIHKNENPPKQKYRPHLSESLRLLNEKLKATFPYLDYQIWETKILNEFMVLQVGQNHLILDVEKETTDSVFNRLSEEYSGKIFLDPDRSTMERYVQQLPEAIIISKLISQTPMGNKVEGIPYATIEKILVDLLADDEKFFTFRGNELVSIYNGVFNSYLINSKSLIRYAGRRKAIPKLKDFVINKTQIEIFGLHSEKK